AEQLRARLLDDLPGVLLALGKEAPTVATWARSLREAEQALLLGRQLLDPGRVLDFGDLGVYRLLALLRESPELWEFYRTTLAALADYDRTQDAELLKTLEMFFANLGNLTRNAEDRLALWIALKAHRVLRTLDEAENGL